MFKNQFLGTAPDPADPPDPPEMEHEVRLPTHQQRAGGQDDVSLNKLPQMISSHGFRAYSYALSGLVATYFGGSKSKDFLECNSWIQWDSMVRLQGFRFR